MNKSTLTALAAAVIVAIAAIGYFSSDESQYGDLAPAAGEEATMEENGNWSDEASNEAAAAYDNAAEATEEAAEVTAEATEEAAEATVEATEEAAEATADAIEDSAEGTEPASGETSTEIEVETNTEM